MDTWTPLDPPLSWSHDLVQLRNDNSNVRVLGRLVDQKRAGSYCYSNMKEVCYQMFLMAKYNPRQKLNSSKEDRSTPPTLAAIHAHRIFISVCRF